MPPLPQLFLVFPLNYIKPLAIQFSHHCENGVKNHNRYKKQEEISTLPFQAHPWTMCSGPPQYGPLLKSGWGIQGIQEVRAP